MRSEFPWWHASILLTFEKLIHVCMQFCGRLGYKGEGDAFDEDGAPHMLYLKTIAL